MNDYQPLHARDRYNLWIGSIVATTVVAIIAIIIYAILWHNHDNRIHPPRKVPEACTRYEPFESGDSPSPAGSAIWICTQEPYR